MYNSKVFKGDDEEEYVRYPIFRELPHGERQYEGLAEVASELRVPTALLSSMRRDPHVTGEEAERLRRVREIFPNSGGNTDLVRPEP